MFETEFTHKLSNVLLFAHVCLILDLFACAFMAFVVVPGRYERGGAGLKCTIYTRKMNSHTRNGSRVYGRALRIIEPGFQALLILESNAEQ